MDLSIIIPCYNVEEYVSDCLKSVANLTDLTYEIILVNDGSKDGTLHILQEFNSAYSGACKLINQENKGLSGARNAGMAVAEGDYICFLDSDDYVDGEQLSKLVRCVIRDKVEIGFGDYNKKTNNQLVTVKATENRYRKIGKLDTALKGIDYAEKVYDRRKNYIISEACYSIFSRYFLERNGLFFKEGIYHEDTLFFYQCIVKAELVKYYRINFYIYNIHSGSITTSENTIQKRTKDKLYIANELMAIKTSLEQGYFFIDSYIINLCYSCRNIIDDSNCGKMNIWQYRKLTLKSLIMMVILRFRGIL